MVRESLLAYLFSGFRPQQVPWAFHSLPHVLTVLLCGVWKIGTPPFAKIGSKGFCPKHEVLLVLFDPLLELLPFDEFEELLLLDEFELPLLVLFCGQLLFEVLLPALDEFDVLGVTRACAATAPLIIKTANSNTPVCRREAEDLFPLCADCLGIDLFSNVCQSLL